MTPVGHSLVGASIGLLAASSSAGRWMKLAIIAAFVVLANIPDAHLPGWGHDRYDISHSIFVNAGLIAVIGTGLALLPRLRRRIGGSRIIFGGAAAWLSHLLLDSFYNHGLGVAIFWPLSSVRLALPLPWFETLRRPFPFFDSHSARVMAIELVAYGSLLVLVWVGRRILLRHAGHSSAVSQ